MHARQSGSPGNSAGVISAFVDSIDSQIILRMIRESKIIKGSIEPTHGSVCSDVKGVTVHGCAKIAKY